MEKISIKLELRWKPIQGWMIKKGSNGNIFFALIIWSLFKSTPIKWHYDIKPSREAL